MTDNIQVASDTDVTHTPLNADELGVTLATIPKEPCEHGINLSLCKCYRCDGTAIYTEADRKKHELQAVRDYILSLGWQETDNEYVAEVLSDCDRIAKELEKL